MSSGVLVVAPGVLAFYSVNPMTSNKGNLYLYILNYFYMLNLLIEYS
jgi:hypothetical protein